MLKQIKRYELSLTDKNELVKKLTKLGFKEGSWLKEYNGREVMSRYFCLVDDIELHITFDIGQMKFDDFDDVLVLDDNFCQPYTSFYTTDNLKTFSFLEKVIKAYNRNMDTLVDAGILKNKSTTIPFNKLVRDKIVPIIEEDGYTCSYREITDTKEAHKLLVEKLKEEADEFYKNPSIEELADILEVIDTLKKINGLVDEKKLQEYKEKKKNKKGGFDGLIFLEEAHIGNNND